MSELSKSLYAYDTVNHSWLLLDEDVSKEDELPRGLYGHTINVINGYVYLFGGTSGTFYFNTIYRNRCSRGIIFLEIFKVSCVSGSRPFEKI